jgi:hypothetical protein
MGRIVMKHTASALVAVHANDESKVATTRFFKQVFGL